MSLITQGHVDPAGVAVINRLIAEEHIRWADYRAEVDSTNTAAMNDLRQQTFPIDQLPRLYLADQQTAGRGRHGRTWLSENQSLTFSLVTQHETSDQIAMLPIMVGVAVARAVEFSFAPLKSRLKWPNDVYVDGGKVAGILVESTQASPNQFVLGIGMNVNLAPQLSDEDHPATPKAIASVIGRSVDRFELLENVIHQLGNVFSDEAVEVVADFRKRCWLTGFEVGFETAGSTTRQTGVCRGIDERGQLIVEIDGQSTTHTTGEVRRMRLL